MWGDLFFSVVETNGRWMQGGQELGGGFVCQREGDGFHHGSRLAGESARDNGRMAVGDWDGSPHPRGQRERGWSPASVFAGAGSPRGDWDGSSHPRGQWKRGWSPASVFAGASSPRGDWDGDGSPHPRGQRERGWSPASVFAGAGSPRGEDYSGLP